MSKTAAGENRGYEQDRVNNGAGFFLSGVGDVRWYANYTRR